MASFRYERRIAAPADVTWSIVHQPESIPDWFPGIESCTVDGSIRTIVTATGLTMPEEILINDSLQRRFLYQITSALFEYHTGTIDVIELAADESLCVYSTTAKPDALALLIAGGTYGALTEIQRLAEEQVRSLEKVGN